MLYARRFVGGRRSREPGVSGMPSGITLQPPASPHRASVSAGCAGVCSVPAHVAPCLPACHWQSEGEVVDKIDTLTLPGRGGRGVLQPTVDVTRPHLDHCKTLLDQVITFDFSDGPRITHYSHREGGGEEAW